MAIDISKLRKSSNLNFNTLTQKINDLSKNTSFNDDRFWSLDMDKSYNGSAVIRFIWVTDVDELPFVRYHNHGFKNEAGKWFIENCPTSINAECPICEENSKLWATNTEANKAIARNRKRKLNHVAKILVISDPKHPENNGKEFLFKFGKAIFDKINSKLNPEFETDVAVNIFDLFNGIEFKMKSKKKNNYPNYDDSSFSETPMAIFNGDEDKIKTLLEGSIMNVNLKDFVSEDKFKKYEDLKAKFSKYLSFSGGETAESLIAGKSIPKPDPRKQQAPVEFDNSGSGDDQSFFESLRDDDIPF